MKLIAEGGKKGFKLFRLLETQVSRELLVHGLMFKGIRTGVGPPEVVARRPGWTIEVVVMTSGPQKEMYASVVYRVF